MILKYTGKEDYTDPQGRFICKRGDQVSFNDSEMSALLATGEWQCSDGTGGTSTTTEETPDVAQEGQQGAPDTNVLTQPGDALEDVSVGGAGTQTPPVVSDAQEQPEGVKTDGNIG